MTPVERPAPEPSPSQSSSEVVPEHWNNIGDELTDNSKNTTASTWQEEAHWMSFRNAVQKFALLKTPTTSIEEEEEDESDAKSGEEVYIPRHTRGLVLSSPSSSSSESALASDLAETRMRLALAQAERDELEFVLFQQHQTVSSTSTMSSPS